MGFATAIIKIIIRKKEGMVNCKRDLIEQGIRYESEEIIILIR
jgi:hypothetical protein